MGGGSAPSGRGARAGIVGINVTPMVDVVLVLLVIMMVSVNHIVRESMKIELPKAGNGDGATNSISAVAISAAGELRYIDEPVTEEQLTGQLRAAFEGNPEVSLVISADKAAAHGKVVRVMDLAREVGIVQFAIGVEKTD
jgi:biopolymer transport protein ExbD